MLEVADFPMPDISYALKMILNIALTVEGMSFYSKHRAAVNDSQANIK